MRVCLPSVASPEALPRTLAQFSALLRELMHIPQYGRTEFKAEFS